MSDVNWVTVGDGDNKILYSDNGITWKRFGRVHLP